MTLHIEQMFNDYMEEINSLGTTLHVGPNFTNYLCHFLNKK